MQLSGQARTRLWSQSPVPKKKKKQTKYKNNTNMSGCVSAGYTSKSLETDLNPTFYEPLWGQVNM
jgi:hypothetical protein